MNGEECPFIVAGVRRQRGSPQPSQRPPVIALAVARSSQSRKIALRSRPRDGGVFDSIGPCLLPKVPECYSTFGLLVLVALSNLGFSRATSSGYCLRLQ